MPMPLPHRNKADRASFTQVELKLKQLFKRGRFHDIGSKEWIRFSTRKDLWTFLLFFLISCCLWLLLTLNGEYEAEIKVPVRLKNLPEEATITDPLPEQIKIKVKDKGLILANYLWFNRFLPISADFADFAYSGERAYAAASGLAKQMSGQLKTTTQILSWQPDTLVFYCVTGEARKMAVLFSGTVSTANQYEKEPIVLTPDSVTVYAPAALLERVQGIETEKISLEHLNDTATVVLNLVPIQGAKFVPDQVTLTVPVIPFTEKSLELPVFGANFPENTALRTFPAKVKAVFNVNAKNIHKIKASDFRVEVDYAQLENGKKSKAIPRLVKMPDGISSVRISPRELDYLIEKPTPE